MNKQRAYTFFGLKMTVDEAAEKVKHKKQELLRLEEAAIRGLGLDYNAIVELKRSIELLDREIKKAEKKIAERTLK